MKVERRDHRSGRAVDRGGRRLIGQTERLDLLRGLRGVAAAVDAEGPREELELAVVGDREGQRPRRGRRIGRCEVRDDRVRAAPAREVVLEVLARVPVADLQLDTLDATRGGRG